MRVAFCIVPFALITGVLLARDSELIRTYDFIEIIDDQLEGAMFYYENNWKVLRQLAKAEGYIDSYEMHEVVYTPESPFHLILITTYADNGQFEQREKNFDKLIAMQGELRLLNEKQPGKFRRFVFGADSTKHRRSLKE